MPCTCWIDDESIEPEMRIIREHVREIVKQMRIIHGKGDLYPRPGAKNSAPRSILEDVHILISDLFNGKCSEGKEILQ